MLPKVNLCPRTRNIAISIRPVNFHGVSIPDLRLPVILMVAHEP